MNALDFDILMKVLVVGQASVGKSSLLNQWANNRFSMTAATTVGIDFKIKSITHNGKKVSIQVWDTAGQERYAPVQRSYYKGSHAVIIVFDVTKPETFEKVTTRWRKDINEYAGENVQVTLVGNKSDLEEERVVSKEQAMALAEQYGYDYLETSAKTAEGVDELFMKLVERLYEKKSYIESQSSAEAASPTSPSNKQQQQGASPSVFAAEPQQQPQQEKPQNLPAPVLRRATNEPVVVLDGSKKQLKPKQASSERGGCC